MEDGSSRPLTLRSLSRDVESRDSGFPIPYLPDFQSEKLADPQSCPDADCDECLVAQSAAPSGLPARVRILSEIKQDIQSCFFVKTENRTFAAKGRIFGQV